MPAAKQHPIDESVDAAMHPVQAESQTYRDCHLCVDSHSLLLDGLGEKPIDECKSTDEYRCQRAENYRPAKNEVDVEDVVLENRVQDRCGYEEIRCIENVDRIARCDPRRWPTATGQ